MPQTCEEVKGKLRRILSDVDAVACTTDLWTSSRTQALYLTVTAHFVVGVEMRTAVLDTKPLPQQHTAQSIADVVQEILMAYDVQHKVVCFVTDNGANVKAALRIMGYRHVPYTAHTINVLVKEAPKAAVAIMAAFVKVKNIVTYFR